MKPRDRCPRALCFGTLRIRPVVTGVFWRARCEKCGRVARLDHNFEWADRPNWLAWGVAAFWVVLIVGSLWLGAWI